MKKFGIELEFFISKETKIIPAYKATTNLDGNPFIGEIRTDIFDNITDAIFDLKRKIYLEIVKLKEVGYELALISEYKFSNEALINARKEKAAIENKEVEFLEEFSIYPKGKLGKVLPRGLMKASLQINISDNKLLYHEVYNKVTVEDKSKWESKMEKTPYSSLFNYVEIISKLDKAFAKDINIAKRVPGVYAIKSGNFGDRIEYRSLPNTVNLIKIIETLKD